MSAASILLPFRKKTFQRIHLQKTALDLLEKGGIASAKSLSIVSPLVANLIDSLKHIHRYIMKKNKKKGEFITTLRITTEDLRNLWQ
jgi:hypothetical protein